MISRSRLRWAIPLTILWLIACTNAINLIDGLDGLASGVALFATLAALSAAAVQGNIGLMLAAVPLAGCLVGFLRYNFNPASVFLGDSGSLTIGFLLGCFAVIWCQKSATLIGMAAPLIALSLRLWMSAYPFSPRFISDQVHFTADRGHIHHRLLAQGLQPRRAALLLYGVCGVAAIVASAGWLRGSAAWHWVNDIDLRFCVLCNLEAAILSNLRSHVSFLPGERISESDTGR